MNGSWTGFSQVSSPEGHAVKHAGIAGVPTNSTSQVFAITP
ncbi:hypothetical protein OG331_48010 [Streptomyces sp. NBC_01017]|nr:hypothetical protein OG331_03970 [Streptomyces sp. NBC_01017]WSV34799.1 hypothetical protein OG331_48010 [Streptomyces sp. NBC_01017]